MSSRLNPYISFDTQAREAIEYYRDVFGGELAMNTFGEFGMEGEASEQIMHAQLETPQGFTLMASDTPPPVAPRDAPLFHTVSEVTVPPSACSVVPPHATTCGLDAGKSTCTPGAEASPTLNRLPDGPDLQDA